MEIKLKAGDSIAIPQGLKAEIKDNVVVFEEIKPKFETFGDFKKNFPKTSALIELPSIVLLYQSIDIFYDFFDETPFEIVIFRTIDFKIFECRIYKNNELIGAKYANTRKYAFLDGLFYLCGIYEKTL